METTTDRLTGLRRELFTTLALPPSRVWELIADVPAIGSWSPECIGATWLDGASAAAPGARFAAENRFRTGDDSIVRAACGVVTEAAPHRTFSWDVLDEQGDVGSSWRYELTAFGPATRVRHTFEHGPGVTGMRLDAEADRTSLDRRLGTLATNMSATLAAMDRHLIGLVA